MKKGDGMDLKSTLNSHIDILKTSLKFNKKVWMTFVLIMALGAFLAWRSGASGLESMMTQSNPDLQMLQGSLAGFLVMLILAIIVAYVAYLKIFSYFKGKIWFTLAEKKLTYQKWLRLFGMSALVLTPFLLLFLLMVRSFGPTNALGIFILFPVLNHFGTLMFLNFTKKKKFWKTVGRGLKQGFTLLPKLIVPYVIVFLVAWLLNSFFRLIFVNNIVFSLSVLLVYLVWITWTRYYVYLTIERSI